jgi:hypothetical protein
VAVQEPQQRDVSALATTARTQVTSASYQKAAASLIRRLFGPDVELQPQYKEEARPAGRTNDTPPFFGGDLMENTTYGEDCTGGFNTTGNNSGRDFMIGSGHCGSGTWVTSAATVGKTSTNYLTTASGNDFQTIATSGGGGGYVWTGPNAAPVVGALIPAVGGTIAFDGAVTGEVRYNEVTDVNITVPNIHDGLLGITYTLTNQIEAENPSESVQICTDGDSGGPVISHTGTSDVNAIGTISAYFSADVGGQPQNWGSECLATMIGHIESVTNTTLMTS